MARVEMIMEAQVAAAIRGINRIDNQLQKIEKTNRNINARAEKFLGHMKTAAIHLATSYGVFRSIAMVQDGIKQTAEDFKEELRGALEIAKEMQDIKAPQFMFAGGMAQDVRGWQLARATGIGAADIERARTGLAAQLPAQQVPLALATALRMKRLAPQAEMGQIATGIADIIREAPGFNIAQVGGLPIFMQREAKGQFEDILQPTTRGFGMGMGLGLEPAQAMGLMAAITQGPWEAGTAQKALRMFMLETLPGEEQTAKGRRLWTSLGLRGVGQWEKLMGLGEALNRGAVTPRQLERMFGKRQFIPIFRTLQRQQKIYEKVEAARAILEGPDVVDAAMREMYADPVRRQMLALEQQEQIRAYEQVQLAPAGIARERARLRAEHAYARIGGGAVGWGRAKVAARAALTGLFPPAIALFPAEYRRALWLEQKQRWAGIGELPGEEFEPGGEPGGVEALLTGTEPQVPPANAGQRNINLGTEPLGEE